MKLVLEKLARKKHVIWDWNGTLLDDLDYVVQIINPILESNSIAAIDKATYQNVFGFPVKKYYERIGFDFTKHNFEELSHQFVETYMQGVHACQMFPHAKEIIQFVKHDLKLKQSILSASDQVSLDHVVKHFGVSHLFDHVMGIADRFAGSKLKRGFDLLEVSGVDVKDTVLLGDTDHDLEVGKELGVDVILLAHGHQSQERLRKIHHDVFRLD